MALGCRVWGLGFRGLGFGGRSMCIYIYITMRVWGLGFRVEGLCMEPGLTRVAHVRVVVAIGEH